MWNYLKWIQMVPISTQISFAICKMSLDSWVQPCSFYNFLPSKGEPHPGVLHWAASDCLWIYSTIAMFGGQLVASTTPSMRWYDTKILSPRMICWKMGRMHPHHLYITPQAPLPLLQLTSVRQMAESFSTSSPARPTTNPSTSGSAA